MIATFIVISVLAGILCWGSERIDRPRRRAMRDAERSAMVPAE